MGREVKRVPLDFKWPIGKTWGGFLRPPENEPVTCDACEGNGYNPATKQLCEDWYDHAGFGSRWWYDYKTGHDGKPATNPPWKVFGESRCWQYQLEQDEVDNLVAENRLMEWTHTFTPGTGWKPDPSKPRPTAEQINHAMKFGFGHDGINQGICVRFRAQKLGFYGMCPKCNGESYLFKDEAQQAAYDGWTETPIPEGPGYQMWETVSEGSPLSPVFDTPTKLAAWLVRNRASSFGSDTASFAAWMAMIEQGWAPSAIASPSKGFQAGVTVALILTKPVINLYPLVEPDEPVRRFGVTHYDSPYYEEDYRNSRYFRHEPATKTETFEAIFPDGDTQADSVEEFIEWMKDRKIDVQQVGKGRDDILTGSLTMDQAMEFKMRWV